MRTTLTVKSVAAMYALALLWTVAMVGGALVLTAPMGALYDSLGIESAVVHLAATGSLVTILATSLAVGVALVLRAAVAHDHGAGHGEAVPEIAPRRS